MTITVEPTGAACGATVTGVDLTRPLSEQQVAEIRAAWLEHLVLSFPGQAMSDDDLERFTCYFGGFGEDPFFAPIPGREHIAAIRRAIDAANHPALFMVDCIASLACVEYRMDEWGVDVTVGASQKGLMVPPGLGIVWASKRAMDAHTSADMRSPYWDWTNRLSKSAHYLRYCGTAPIQHIYAMRTALDMLQAEGLETAWARHTVFADAVRAAVAAWAAPGGLEFNVLDPGHRSNSTTTILTGNIDGERLRRLCEDYAGLTLGIGLGDLAQRSFRIGHMGSLNPPMVLGTLGTVEAALTAIEGPMPHSGVAAAARVIATAFN